MTNIEREQIEALARKSVTLREVWLRERQEVLNEQLAANEEVKKQEKAKTLSEDDAKKALELVQKKTDEKTSEIDKVIASKEKEILTI